MLEKGKAGATYHVGGCRQIANLDLLKMLLGILGKPQSLLTSVTDRLGHDRRYAVDCSRIQKELGWTPEIPLEEGLRSTVEWYASNGDWIAHARSGEYQAYYQRVYAI